MGSFASHSALLVDDNEPVRWITEEILIDLGFEVLAVDTPARVLDIVAEGCAPELLVTDIVMPEVDGWTLAERVREVCPDMPILYITGHYDDEGRPVSNSLVVRKPFTMETIGRALAALTSGLRGSDPVVS